MQLSSPASSNKQQLIGTVCPFSNLLIVPSCYSLQCFYPWPCRTSIHAFGEQTVNLLSCRYSRFSQGSSVAFFPWLRDALHGRCPPPTLHQLCQGGGSCYCQSAETVVLRRPSGKRLLQWASQGILNTFCSQLWASAVNCEKTSSHLATNIRLLSMFVGTYISQTQ